MRRVEAGRWQLIYAPTSATIDVGSCGPRSAVIRQHCVSSGPSVAVDTGVVAIAPVRAAGGERVSPQPIAPIAVPVVIVVAIGEGRSDEDASMTEAPLAERTVREMRTPGSDMRTPGSD